MKNLMKIICRSFIRKPAMYLINISGLSIGLTLVIVLSVYCYSEFTTDNFHKNVDRIYFLDNNGIYIPGVLKDVIDQSVPGVETTVRLAGSWEAPVYQVENHDPITSDILFADEDFFRLFTYHIIEGRLEDALNEPLTIVITKPLSEKLFGNNPAVGKIIKYNNGKELTVKAVVANPQGNSCIQFSAVTSMATRKIIYPNGGEFTEWGWRNFQTFLLLKKDVSPEEAAKRIIASLPENEKKGYATAKLNPLNELYFSKAQLFGGNYLLFGDKTKIKILLWVAVLILIISLVNFINIISSQWLERIRQTGIMKIVGAKRMMIMRNVIAESMFLFFVSLILSYIFVHIATPFIKNNTGISFDDHVLKTPSFFLITIAATFLFSLLFNIFPALKISSSKSIDNLKKAVSTNSKGSTARGILVTIQFVIAMVLIAFTILIQKQVNFGSSQMGFSQDNVIGIGLTAELREKKDVLQKLLTDKPFVKEVSFGQYFPGRLISRWTTFKDENGRKKQFDFDIFNADASFFNLIGIKLTKGRFYSKDLPSDNEKIIVNETFVREHKLDNPLGLVLPMGMEGHESEIIGVVNDFHYKSFTQPIGSLIIKNDPYAFYCLANLETNDFNSLHKALQQIKSDLASLSPSFPVEVSFMDNAIEKLYKSELQFRHTFSLFAFSAIVICCLGILAISLFTCQQRTKEIGIRKVNGARITEVIAMLNRDFIKWVVIAFLIACPIAWYAMHKWLQNFAYKTELSWWVFAAAGVLAVFIALITVSWQSWRAATRNPVESLRYE